MSLDVDRHLKAIQKVRFQDLIHLCILGVHIFLLATLYLMQNRYKYRMIFYLSISLLFIFCLSQYFYQYVQNKIRLNSMGLSYHHPPLLFDLPIPAFVYKVSNLNFGYFKIENIIFNDAGICIMDSFKVNGILKGNVTQYLLDIQVTENTTYCRKVKNPFRSLRFKNEYLGMILRLYDIHPDIHSGLYLPNAKWDNPECLDLKENLICGENSLKNFMKQFKKLSLKRMNQELSKGDTSNEIVYVFMSIRYFEYLRAFYHQLIPLQKINLKKQLSDHALILFEFIILKDSFTMEKLTFFMEKNQKILEIGMKNWQETLFFELNQYFELNQEIAFSSFNIMGLMMSEGFVIKQGIPILK